MNADPQSPTPESPGPQSPGPQAPGPQAPPPPPGLETPAGVAVSAPVGGTPPLSSVGKRFGAYLLEGALIFVTLVIGWLIWSLIILGRGQTPAKQLLHMRVVRADTGGPVGYGKMFVREFLAKFVIGLVSSVTFGLGLILYFWLCWDDKNQELWDKMVGTVVVEDPEDRLDPRNLAPAA